MATDGTISRIIIMHLGQHPEGQTINQLVSHIAARRVDKFIVESILNNMSKDGGKVKKINGKFVLTF